MCGWLVCVHAGSAVILRSGPLGVRSARKPYLLLGVLDVSQSSGHLGVAQFVCWVCVGMSETRTGNTSISVLVC